MSMKKPDLLVRLPLLLLLAIAALAAPPTWRYYPVNTIEAGVATSGLYFHVDPPSTFTVTAVTRSGTDAPVTTTGREMSTDPGRDFLPVRIVNLDRFRVLQITITIGKKTLVFTEPVSGTSYLMEGR